MTSAATGAHGGSAPALLHGAFRCTDIGNAERFAARYRGDVRYSHERKRWLYWDGVRWCWDKGGHIYTLTKAVVRGIRAEVAACNEIDVRKALEEWAKKSEGAGKLAAIEALARGEPGIPIAVDDLDRDPWVLNCANGTLDLRNGVLLPHAREDLITKTTGVDYQHGATSPVWDQVLELMTGGDNELAAYLQRVAGYALTGVSTEKKFFFLHGPPDSGKSSYIHALMIALGDYAKATPFETWLERMNASTNRDDLVDLQGVRLVTSGEVAQNARWNTALVKQITGGDKIKASAKFEPMVEFRAACTIILAANETPRARDDDDGFWSRMQRVPITNVVPPERRLKNFYEVLAQPENAQAILAWAVEGCLMWQRQGVGTAAVVARSTEEYREDQDWLGGFLELYEPDAGAVIYASDFRAAYEQYCKAEGQLAEPTKTLAARIAKRLPGVRYKTVKGKRIWCGLRLRDGAYARAEEAAALAREAVQLREPEQLDLDMPPEERRE